MRKEKYEYMSKFCKIEEKKYIYYFICWIVVVMYSFYRSVKFC